MSKDKGTPSGVGITNLLIQEDPLLVLPSLAVAIGLNEAIFLQQIHFHLRFSKNERDGQTWVYNTFEEWQEEMPWWSISTLKRIVSKLQKIGLLITTSQYNKMPIDKTLWYTIDYTAVVRLKDHDVSSWHVDSVNLARPSCQIDTMCSAKLTLPITKEDPKIYNRDLDDDALRNPSVKEDRAALGSARADRPTPASEWSPVARMALRNYVRQRIIEATGPDWDDCDHWLEQADPERLRATLLWCEVHKERLMRDPDSIDNAVGFIRNGVETGKAPGLPEQTVNSVDGIINLILEMAEEGIYP